MNKSTPGAVLSWPVAGSNLVLEATANLVSPVDWLPITSGFVDVGALRTLPIDTSVGTQLYYRLRKP